MIVCAEPVFKEHRPVGGRRAPHIEGVSSSGGGEQPPTEAHMLALFFGQVVERPPQAIGHWSGTSTSTGMGWRRSRGANHPGPFGHRVGSVPSCEESDVETAQRLTPEAQRKIPGTEKLLSRCARNSEDGTGERHVQKRGAPSRGEPERSSNPVERRPKIRRAPNHRCTRHQIRFLVAVDAQESLRSTPLLMGACEQFPGQRLHWCPPSSHRRWLSIPVMRFVDL